MISGLVILVAATGAIYGLDAAISAARRSTVWLKLGAVFAILLVVPGIALLLLTLLGKASALVGGITLTAAAVVLALIVSGWGRRTIAHVLPLESASPRDWVGLLVIVWLVILRLALFYRAETDVSEVKFDEAAVQTVVLVAIACALVGLFVRRNLRQALRRLGIRQLGFGQTTVAMVLVVPFATVAALSVLSVEYIQPGTMDRLENTVTGMTGGNTSLEFGLMLGISAAVGEETLFRGALQPKYGIVFTSLVFALLHVQYDLLLIVASLFPVGIILGLERKYMGTTASMVTHALYNALVAMAGY